MQLLVCNLGGFAVETHTASEGEAELSIEPWNRRFIFLGPWPAVDFRETINVPLSGKVVSVYRLTP